MTDLLRVALDGPSGAGKSTIAKALASELGLDYIDTGAMYRAVGYKILKKGISLDDQEKIADMLRSTDIDFAGGRVLLDGEDISGLIRRPEISMAASRCSAYGAVREKLVALQRAMGIKKSVIMDGRDIGSNVLPMAEFKIFLTASPEERADRRYRELLEKGESVTYEQVLEDINQRDYNDTHRELNPLVRAEGAIDLDTTGMGIEDVVNRICGIIGKEEEDISCQQ